MKNRIALLAVLAAAVLMFIFPLQPAARSSFGAQLVGLPEEGLQLVLFLVTAGVAWLLLQIGVWLGLDLSGYVQPIVAIVAPIIVTFIEKYLGMIPPSLDSVVLTIIHLLVLLIGGAVGMLTFARRFQRPASLLAT